MCIVHMYNIFLQTKPTYKLELLLLLSGLSKTLHHEEIPGDTLDKIYQLIYHVFEALANRDDNNILQKHLKEIPVDFHNKLHYLARDAVQVSIWAIKLQVFIRQC